MGSSETEKLGVQNDCRRFNQKYEMFCRSIWDEEFAKTLPVPNYAVALTQRALQQIRSRNPGHALRETSLCWASWTLASLENVGPGWREGNRGLFSWAPLGASTSHHSQVPLWQYAKVEPERLDDPVVNTASITKMARVFGASDVGITRLDRRWIYSDWWSRYTRQGGEIKFSDEMDDPGKYSEPTELLNGTRIIPSKMEYVIVLGFERGYEGMATSPDGVAGCETGLGYSKMAFTTPILAEYIRNLGFNAIPTGNDTALSVPLAVDAGLGQLGRNGLLVSPKYGSRLALSKIITDMPLALDHPTGFGVTDFCRTCKKCAENCPSGAISSDEPTWEGDTISNNPGSLKWYLDAERCMKFWTDLGEDCSNCIRVCPFNKPPGLIHDFVRAIIKRTSILNGFFTRLDDAMGYGKKKDSKDYF